MILDHTLYHPLLPQGERGRDAWIKRSASSTPLGKRSRGDDREQPVVNANRRKLRRTASAKLGSQNEGIWCDIVGNVSEPRLEREDEWAEAQKVLIPEGKIQQGVDFAEAKVEKADEKRNAETARSALGGKHAGPPGPKRGIFGGLLFFVHGFDERKVRNDLAWHLSLIAIRIYATADLCRLRELSCAIICAHMMG